MSFRQHEPPVDDIIFDLDDSAYDAKAKRKKNSKSRRTRKTSSAAPRKANVRSKPPISAREEDQSDDQQLEFKLSLAHSHMFLDDHNDDGIEEVRGKTCAMSTDNETYNGSSLESWGSDDELCVQEEPTNKSSFLSTMACGDDVKDASSVFVKSVLDSTREISIAISLGIKHTYITKSKQAEIFFQERDRAKKEKAEQLEEERRLKQENQLRQEMRTARDEVGRVANLWRER